MDDEEPDPDAARIRELMRMADEKFRAIPDAIKAQLLRGETLGPGEQVLQVLTEFEAHRDAANREIAEIQSRLGISEELLARFEGKKHWRFGTRHIKRRDVARIKTTASIDEQLPDALANVRRAVPADWFAREAERRPSPDFFMQDPFCLLSGRHFRLAKRERPHRVARMVMAAEDHLRRRDELDVWDASLLIPETVALGTQIEALTELGAVGLEKFQTLWSQNAEAVGGTIFELLVAGACVRTGLKASMMPDITNPRTKTPDIRIHDFGMPLVVECKRKSSFTEQAKAEAAVMASVFGKLRARVRGSAQVRLELSAPLCDAERVCQSIERIWRQGERSSADESWGIVTCEPLNERATFEYTRLYSPAFLAAVFDWDQEASFAWDGLICKVDTPSRLLLDTARNPLALVWKQTIDGASPAKFRGITSLFADGVSQIPAGEAGVVYVAVEEGTRADFADLRNEVIAAELRNWTMKWGSVALGVVVDRIYPHPVGEGRPDLAEAVVRYGSGSAPADTMANFPVDLFVPEP